MNKQKRSSIWNGLYDPQLYPHPAMAPQHGETRGPGRVETFYPGRAVTYINAETGEPMYQGPITSRTATVQERYCGYCHKYQQATGLIGGMLCIECGHEWDEAPA